MAKYLFFLFVFRVLGLLPLVALYWIANVVGDLGYLLFPNIRANVLDNMRHVFPPGTPEARVRRAARQVFRNVALYYADTAYMPRLDTREFFDKRLTVHGLYEELLPRARSGEGVIMMSAHFGNPELAGQGLIPCGVRVFALTEPLKPARLSRLVDGIRSSHGHAFGPVSVGNVKRAIKTLRQGGVVVLMGDRDIEGPRMKLPFFGEEAWLPTGPIEVALRTGVPVVPSFSARRGRNLEAYMEEPLKLARTGDLQEDVRAGALEFLGRLEKRIRAEPEQWAVFERIWEAAPREGATQPDSRVAAKSR